MNHKCYSCGHFWTTKEVPAVNLPDCPKCKSDGIDWVIHSVFEIIKSTGE